MSILNGFNRKNVQANMELEIIITKLQFLASCMENNTDKPSDLKHWQENMTNLYDLQIKNVAYLSFIKDAYHTLYKLYLKKHHPELTD
ncbi:hypothetical protein CVD28_04305 [Bacillus sp. M6-12]|uniref:hypothetical protein n=1 Tax=Bacillus sp. M6-12 TaxID=2054166 RepID=UPI000C7807F0|nr:hypothetical protein [Bacillus sp. M6-12]PLS19647.1 hypothetical protein CVD28_04305 [Bacillus sp. M6-12]